MTHTIQCRCRYCAAGRGHRAYELELAEKVKKELMQALDERAASVAANMPVQNLVDD